MSQPVTTPPGFSLSAVRFVCRDGAATIVWLGGEHDAATVHELRGALGRAVAADHNDLVVDVADVTFMNAATLGALIGARNTLRKQDRFITVRGSTRCVDRLFELCDVASFFDARPSTTGQRREPVCGSSGFAASLRPNRDFRLQSRSAFRGHVDYAAHPDSPSCASHACGFWSEPGVCTVRERWT